MEQQPEPKARSPVLLPKRPRGEKANSFRKVSLVTNHYGIKITKPLDKIVIFSIRFEPKIVEDNRNLRQSILEKILPDVRKTIDNPVMSGFNIYSLKESLTKEKEYTADNHKITIKEVKVFDVAQNPHLLLVFLNNGLKRLMLKNRFQELGKAGGRYFDTSKMNTFDNLRLYDGYKANFVRLEKGIFLRVDSIKKVVRETTVLEFINGFYKEHAGKDKEDIRQLINQELSNKIVMSNYATMRYYRVTSVVFKKGSEVDLGLGQNMLDYFKKRYEITIRNPSQPLLEVEVKIKKNPSNPTYLFPELCLMTGIPDEFDEMRRKKVSEATILNPPEKYNAIDGLMGKLKSSHELDELRSLGIDLSKSMTEFEAKVIPVPRLLLGAKNSVEEGKEAFFNLFNKPIYSPKHEVYLGMIFFRGTDVKAMVSTFTTTSKNLGVSLKIKEYEISGRSVKDILNQFKSLSESVNICLIVIPNNMKNDYKKIKLESITNMSLLTQVVTEGTLRKKNIQSIATKILLQIIAKRGNTLWVPDIAKRVEESMLLGFDYAKSGNKTFVSACATINSTYSSLYSKHDVCEQPSEKFRVMTVLALDCIKGYKDRNGSPPKELLIFFNSCTSDQIVTYHELFFAPLLKELKEIFPNNQLAITGVMVNVKNSERFFINEKVVRNVQAGTLVNSQIVSENYDFFLISQQSNKGSTVPNHYKVIFNTSKMEEGALQELIFGQCFNYVNWTGSIKVPSVLQYAKKSAKFSSEVLERSKVPVGLFGKPYFV